MNKRTTLFLIGILIIATFLRVYELKTTPPGLYPDEAMNGSNALEALRTHDFKVFYPENNGREGLFMNIQALFVAHFGREPWALRLPSTIFGILTVLGLFFLTRELFIKEYGERKATNIALLAAFFLATSFWHINFSRIGFRAITAPFFGIWAFYFFLLALRKAYENTRKRSWAARGYSIVAGIILGLGAYSYIAYRVLPVLAVIIFGAMWWRYGKNREALHAGLHLVLWSLIVFFPLGLYFAHNPSAFLGRTSEVSVTAAGSPLRDFAVNLVKTVGMLNFKGDGNWRHNFADRPELFLPVGILFWIGILLALKKRRISDLFLFPWLALATLPVALSNEGIPHALRSILMIPPLMIFAAMGGVWVYEKLNEHASVTARKVLVVVSYIFFLLLTIEAYHTYFVLWARNPNVQGAFAADYVAIGREINSLPSSTPKYVVIQAGGGTAAVPGSDNRQIPIPAQTVMFMTDSWSLTRQSEQNIHYVLPGEESSIPQGAQVFYIK